MYIQLTPVINLKYLRTFITFDVIGFSTALLIMSEPADSLGQSNPGSSWRPGCGEVKVGVKKGGRLHFLISKKKRPMLPVAVNMYERYEAHQFL